MATDAQHPDGRQTAQLLAIVEVAYEDRIRCQQPDCHHVVYRAVHIVQEGESLLVLGSTCFAKRYGHGE